MRDEDTLNVIGCLGVMLVGLLLWVLILTAISRLVGCSVTLESGIHDSMRAESEAPPPTPTPTPAR